MKSSLIFWGEKYLFSPGNFEKLLSFLLLPFSLLYCFIVWTKYKFTNGTDFELPIISIGNLIVGGSGKTPVTVALASRYKDAAIVLRGYGRESKGVYLVSDGTNILVDVKISGDEAMLYAKLLPQCRVIVAEDRTQGINMAKSLGTKLVFLDDAYSKHFIKKLDLVIMSQQNNNFCLPSGPFRERLWKGKEARCIEENKDFVRHVNISNETKKMVLVTAISKPQRLDPFLNENVIKKVYFPDHHVFTQKVLEDILKDTEAESLLVTHKDAVKLDGFGLALSFLDLEIQLNEEIHQIVEEYVKIATLK